MKKIFTAFCGLMLASLPAVAQQDEKPTEVPAWYKTWFTPTDCRMGKTVLQYNEKDDWYTTTNGICNDDYGFWFKFLPNGENAPLLSLLNYNGEWFSSSDWTFVNYSDQYSAAIDAGEYYWFTGDASDFLAGGALYIPQLAYDVDGQGYSCLNYYHTPTLVWPAKDAERTVPGTYTDGRTGQARECALDVYDNEFVITAFNGVKGYDIPFAEMVGEEGVDPVVYFENQGGWYTPQMWADYDFYVWDRMACDAQEGIALKVTNLSVDEAAGKMEMTYDTYSMTGWNGATYTRLDGPFTDTFTWETEGVESTAMDQTRQQPAQYFDLSGRRVSQPQSGVYVKLQDGKATKVVR